jgi:hypothetical protein
MILSQRTWNIYHLLRFSGCACCHTRAVEISRQYVSPMPGLLLLATCTRYLVLNLLIEDNVAARTPPRTEDQD